MHINACKKSGIGDSSQLAIGMHYYHVTAERTFASVSAITRHASRLMWVLGYEDCLVSHIMYNIVRSNRQLFIYCRVAVRQ